MSKEFYPSNAIWHNFPSYTYLPHSNEYGPHTLMALSVFALHPDPSQNMLLPYVNSNLAQISRWWVARSLINQEFPLNIFNRDVTPSQFTYPPLWNQNSDPANLAMLINTQIANISTQDSSPPLSTTLSNYKNYNDYPNIQSRTVDQTPDTPISNTIMSPLEKPTYQKTKSPNKITKWLEFRPFTPRVQTVAQRNIPNNNTKKPTETLVGNETHTINIAPTHPRKNYTNHLSPFGTPLPPMTNSNILRICFQNTQHSFQIHGEAIELPNLISNLQSLGIGMFIPISPNINWMESTKWPRTHQIIKPHFHQVHLSATSSNIGNDPNFFNRHLVRGAGISTLSQWAYKVSGSSMDTSGNGTYTITTTQGKGNKFISFTAAYIAVQKGSDYWGRITLRPTIYYIRTLLNQSRQNP